MTNINRNELPKEPEQINPATAQQAAQQLSFKIQNLHNFLQTLPYFSDKKVRDNAMRIITRALSKPTEWLTESELRHNFSTMTKLDAEIIVAGLCKLKVFKSVLYKNKSFYMIDFNILTVLQDPRYDSLDTAKLINPNKPPAEPSNPQVTIIKENGDKPEIEIDDYQRLTPKPGQKGHTRYLLEIEKLKLEYLERECEDLMWIIVFGRRDTTDWRIVFNQRKSHVAAWLHKLGDYTDWTEEQIKAFYADLEMMQQKVYGRQLCDFDWETKEIVILPIEASPYKGTVPSRLPCPYSGNREIPLYIENFYPNQSRKDGFP